MNANNVTPIRPVPPVESFDPALPAALDWVEDWVEEHDPQGRTNDLIAAFVAGARSERRRMAEETDHDDR